MTLVDWATVTAASLTSLALLFGALRWIVKHYLYELKPNSGSSMKDAVTRLESRVDEIYRILAEK